MADQILTKDDEKAFEEHFCNQLDINGYSKVRKQTDITVDKDLCIYFDDLEEFFNKTQQEKLNKLKGQYGAGWQKEFAQVFQQQLASKQLFEVLQKGITIGEFHFELIYFKPERENNKDLMSLYGENVFTAVRQWYFGQKSLDIVLLVNGFAIVTIELKNEGTSGDYETAINQYLQRDLNLPIFKQPFLHIACDTETVKMAAAFSEPPSERDFRDFNMDLINEVEPNIEEYPVHYLYHDILLPDRLLNYLESYLYPGKGNSWIFPRYHQQRATRDVVAKIKEHYIKTGELDFRYLIQHSTGSGKSNTIVWMVQNLRNAFVEEDKIFDSIVVLTDRINLDDQIGKDFQKAIQTDGIVYYAEKTSDLREALEKSAKVIISTIHKFSFLKDLADQKDKNICVIIDEAHRSQEGSLHDGVTGTFSDDKGVEPEQPDQQEGLIADIERKKFPNLAFVALTATPSEKTLEHFGRIKKDKKGKTYTNKDGEPIWEAHDIYSMDQAIAEGYIMDVAKRIYTYDTVYELNKAVESKKEYLPMMVSKALRQKAFEDTEIIKEKCAMMVELFKNESAHKIGGKAKAMVVTSSRLAAVKYKLYMDGELAKKGLSYKALVAFSGKINHNDEEYTEKGLNKDLNPQNLKTEEVFEKNDNIRFLIVASKFQTGFDEPLLHTMFLDKPVRDRTAVQTLSRLNRIHLEKDDTLVVDFTGSYELIMKAYAKYQNDVTTDKSSDPNKLIELKDELLKFGVFTESDVDDIVELGKTGSSVNMPVIAGHIYQLKLKYEANLTDEKKDEFRILIGRYLGIFNYIKALYRIPQQDLWDFQIFLVYLNNKLTNTDYNSLKKELKDVTVVNYAMPEVKFDPPEEGGEGVGGKGSVTKVKVTKTVEEIIEEINAKFRGMIGTKGVEVVGKFLEIVTHDNALLTIVRNNPNKDPDKVFTEIVRDKLNNKLMEVVLDEAPDKYEEIMSDAVRPFINKTAYNLIREAALAA